MCLPKSLGVIYSSLGGSFLSVHLSAARRRPLLFDIYTSWPISISLETASHFVGKKSKAKQSKASKRASGEGLPTSNYCSKIGEREGAKQAFMCIKHPLVISGLVRPELGANWNWSSAGLQWQSRQLSCEFIKEGGACALHKPTPKLVAFRRARRACIQSLAQGALRVVLVALRTFLFNSQRTI